MSASGWPARGERRVLRSGRHDPKTSQSQTRSRSLRKRGAALSIYARTAGHRYHPPTDPSTTSCHFARIGRRPPSAFVMRLPSVLDVDALGGVENAFKSSVLRSSLHITRRVLRNYWHKILANPRSRRPPLSTLATITAMIIVHFTVGPFSPWMSYTPDGPWYCVISAMFSHVSDSHLWMNVLMLGFLGTFLEFTEGSRHVASVIAGGGFLGAASHGAFRPWIRVRGTSGAVYAVMASQLSLLSLNWHEVPRCIHLRSHTHPHAPP